MSRLSGEGWLTAPATQGVMRALEQERPGSARFVGGCVRNALLGERVDDIDIATQLTPESVARVMREAGFAVHETGLAHGTLTIVAQHRPFEVTTLRRDVETDGRRAVVAFTEDWAEDAARRDFRINALYADLNGDVFDPTHRGLEDLQHRRIVFVGDPDTRIREDYLRILRFFRFNAWYGRGEPDGAGFEACARLRDGLSVISVERIWIETKKLLGAPDPAPTLARMKAAGVLSQLFPGAGNVARLERLVALEEEIGVKADWARRFAALFDDQAALSAAFAAMKPSNEEGQRLRYAIPPAGEQVLGASRQEAREQLYRRGAATVRDHVLRAWADSPDKAEEAKALMREADDWTRKTMPVSGDDLIARGVAQGPDLGAALKRLEADWIESDFTLSRDALLSRL